MAKEPRQRHLPNTDPEPKVILEIEDASESYVDVRDRRIALTKEEAEKKSTLREAMKKHKLKQYTYGQKIVKFVHAKEADVKVRTIKPPKTKKQKASEGA